MLKSVRFASPASQVAIAFLSGILMGLTPAPVNAWFFAWVAIAPLWVLVFSEAKGVTLAQRLLLCAAWAVGYHGLALSWIVDLHPLTWMGVPWLASVAIALFAWGFITLWGAGLVSAWFLGSHFLYRFSLRLRGEVPSNPVLEAWLRILIGTALWIAAEDLWSSGALYWTSVSYTQSPYNLAILHLGQLSGPAAITAVIVAVNAGLAEAWRSHVSTSSKPWKLLTFSLSLLLLAHLVGWGLSQRPLAESADTRVKVGIVQGNVPTRIKLFEEGAQLALRNYVRGYESLVNQGVDMVLTPEGALPWLWVGTSYQANNPLYQAILREGVPAIVGTVGQRQGRITQTLFALNGSGAVVGRYDKVKLVPLGEYIPFEAVVGQLINRLSPVEASMLRGTANQHFETPFGRAIAAICYESAFSQLFRDQAAGGGEFILTASNNDPYTERMMAQHHAQDVIRAIETDRWAVRATNTGLSGLVNPHGQTIWKSGYRTFETYVATIHRRQTQTPYVRWGNWLTPLLLVGAIAAALGYCFWAL